MSPDEEFVGYVTKAASDLRYVLQELYDNSLPHGYKARFIDHQLGGVFESDPSESRFLALLSASKKLHSSWQMPQEKSA